MKVPRTFPRMTFHYSPIFFVKTCLLIVMTSVSTRSMIMIQYRGIIILADSVLLNIVACRVYHSLTIAVLQRQSELSTEWSSINFRQGSIDNYIPTNTTNINFPLSEPGVTDKQVSALLLKTSTVPPCLTFWCSQSSRQCGPSVFLDDVYVSSCEREMHHTSFSEISHCSDS